MKLFRWPNLLIVAATQLLYRHAITMPAFEAYGLESAVGGTDFLLLTMATIMICAAGYTINDYFDIQIDRINKPESVVIDTLVSRREAILAHSLLNLAGISIAVILSIRLQMWILTVLYVLGTVVLWLYSFRLKRMLLAGNLVVALMSSFVIGIVWLAEHQAALPLPAEAAGWSRQITSTALLYGFFAFMTSLIREVIKDMEDKKGDAAGNCQTMPLMNGMPHTKKAVATLTIMLILGLAVFQASLWLHDAHILAGYLGIFVQLPLLILIRMIIRGHAPSNYRQAQQLMKAIMVTGILSMMLYG